MTLDKRMDYAARRKNEMNCCQAVLVAFADKLGKSEDDLLRLGSGFGAGMGTMEGTCGALVGAIMISSLLSAKDEAMKNSRAITPRFKEPCRFAMPTNPLYPSFPTSRSIGRRQFAHFSRS